MFECPNCKQETPILIIPAGQKILGCRACVTKAPKAYNVNLGQTVEKWTSTDKKGVERKHRITTGKQWEIEHRTIAEDGKSVINSVTGKDAQY